MATCLGGLIFGGWIRSCGRRFAGSAADCTVTTGPGARWMQQPVRLVPALVAPTCAACMKTTGCSGLRDERACRVCGWSDRGRLRRPSVTTAPGAGRPNVTRSAPDPGPAPPAGRAAGCRAGPGCGSACPAGQPARPPWASDPLRHHGELVEPDVQRLAASMNRRGLSCGCGEVLLNASPPRGQIPDAAAAARGGKIRARPAACPRCARAV